MRNEFTAVIEIDGEWHIAYYPEVPGANGQGKSKDAALESLADAIALILEERREDGLRGFRCSIPWSPSWTGEISGRVRPASYYRRALTM